MFTVSYNGMWINGYCDKATCYVADDYGTLSGIQFKSQRAAKSAITKARNSGVAASRGAGVDTAGDSIYN